MNKNLINPEPLMPHLSTHNTNDANITQSIKITKDPIVNSHPSCGMFMETDETHEKDKQLLDFEAFLDLSH